MNEHDFLIMASHSYDNPACKTLDEFNEDVNRICRIEMLLNKKEINYHLILNHIMVTLNVFGGNAVTLLFYKTSKENWHKLKTFFTFLSVMPDRIEKLNIINTDIDLDRNTMDFLRSI